MFIEQVSCVTGSGLKESVGWGQCSISC